MTTDPRRHDTAPEHIHKRDWRPCPWTLRNPLRPRKPATVFLFEFAEAVQHGDTFEAFVERHPAEFPNLWTAA